MYKVAGNRTFWEPNPVIIKAIGIRLISNQKIKFQAWLQMKKGSIKSPKAKTQIIGRKILKLKTE